MIDPMIAGYQWLEAQNLAVEKHRRQFRRPQHELELTMMTRPMPVDRAYGVLGMMLGTVPPAVIFCRLFGYGGSGNGNFSELGVGLIFLCLMMNLICALVGFALGRALGNTALNFERRSRSQMVLLLALLGATWGIATGAAGGVFFFGFGVFAGPVFAVPVGVVAFLVFGSLHRLLERGGMIDAKHFLPVATGITVVISMLIAVD